MLKTIYLKIIATIFIGTFLSSCNSKKENFDIDLTNFKVPTKNKVEIPKKNEDISSSSENLFIENKLLTYKKIWRFKLNKIWEKRPFSRGETPLNKLNLISVSRFLNTEINKFAFVSYKDKEGTITEESIGGVNTKLLPGAKA